MTSCKCKSPPCTCSADQRETTCGFKFKGKYVEEYRGNEVFRGYQTIPCGKDGVLRDDCNTFFQEKLVLCDEHYPEAYNRYKGVCGMCGSVRSECTC